MDRWRTMVLVILLACAGCDWSSEPDYPEVPTIDRVTLAFGPISGPGETQTVAAVRASDSTFRRADTLALAPGDYVVDLGLFEDGAFVVRYLVERPEEPVLRYALAGGLASRARLSDRFPQLAPLGAETPAATRAAKTAPLPPPGFVVRVDTAAVGGTLRLVLERYENFPPQDSATAPLGTDFDARFPIRIVSPASTP